MKIHGSNSVILKYALILFFPSVLFTGCWLYYQNHAIQIPLVHLLRNPALYPNDPFAMTLPYYSSFLWRPVASVSRLIGLNEILIFGFLVERFLIIYAAGLLAKVFAPKSHLASIAAMVIIALGIEPILGSGTVVERFFEQTGLSIALILLAAVCFYKFRLAYWAILMAIVFYLNIMYGVYALTYFLAAFLFDSSYRQNWKRWVFPLVLFFVLVTPMIILTASSYFVESTDMRLWLSGTELRFPHHLYPLRWGKDNFLRFGLLVGLSAAYLFSKRRGMEKAFKQGIIWTGVSMGWLFSAFVSAYVIRSPFLIVLHPARGTDLWYGFISIALVSAHAVDFDRESNKYGQFLALPFFALIFFWKKYSHFLILTGIVAIVLMIRPVWKYIFMKGNPRRLAHILILLVIFWSARALWIRRTIIVFPPRPMIEVADWARRSVPIEATFLVNPTWEMFRALSQRPVFTTWKDGSAILWYRPFIGPWSERMKMLGFEISQKNNLRISAKDELDRLYQNLQDEDAEKIKRKFPLDYWIVPNRHLSSYPIVFQNKDYKVLSIK